MPEVECENCGNKEFYKQEGFYFCKECQVQSQEIREHVLQGEAEKEDDALQKTKNLKVSTTIRGEQQKKDENRLTSWECYNFILLGLTKELINLGASSTLKEVVRNLWLCYLEKLEVFKRGSTDWPKLQVVGSQKDAQQIYGKSAKRPRSRSVSSSEKLSTLNSSKTEIRREMAKKRKLIVKSKHDDFNQKSQDNPSLHNETLVSLHTNSDKTSKKSMPISYNYYARKELRKRQSRFHLNKHRKDYECKMTCHSGSWKSISYKYKMSPCLLSPNKLYAILYLGLLINRDKIHLGDMIRFIKEGHLTFNNYNKFFPEEFQNENLNFKNHTKNSLFTSHNLRKIASDLAKFLEVEWYISTPDLVHLCERYCSELNLPDEVCHCAKNLMSRAKFKMHFKKDTPLIPNYEARVLSIIFFLLKLLFGLDDVTEHHLTNYANILNKCQSLSPKMFNIVNWLKYIEHRNLLMYQNYFPFQFDSDNCIKKTDCFLNFISKGNYLENLKVGATSKSFNKEKIDITRVLEQLKSEDLNDVPVEFQPTLTTFADYTRLILENNMSSNSPSLTFHKDYKNDSLIYLLKPHQFLKLVNKNETPIIINSGANDNWNVEKIICFEQEGKKKMTERRKFVTVKVHLHRKKCKNPSENISITPVENGENLKQKFYADNEDTFRKNFKFLEKVSKDISFNLLQLKKDLEGSSETYSTHFNPYERYWMRLLYRINSASRKEYDTFFSKFPYNFRLIADECCRIVQQSRQEFLTEFQTTELCLAYSSDFYLKNVKCNTTEDKMIKQCLESSVKVW